MKKIILDVDTGVDDAIAIMLGIADKEMDLLGITTVTGNVTVDKAFLNSARILKYFGKENDIPVFRGTEENLIERNVKAFHVHGEDGLNGMLSDLDVATTDQHAVDWMIKQIRKHPKEITFVGTAPITNLALAIKLAPDIVPLINEVILMTGAFEVPGNVTPCAEFNTYGDPIALQIILDAGLSKVKLVGLDVTKKALLDTDSISGIQNPKVSDFILQMTDRYRALYQALYSLNGCAMHDPLALACVCTQKFCEFEHVYVEVELKAEHTYGKTILDRDQIYQKQPNAYVATSVNPDLFIEYLIKQLNLLV